MLNRTRTIGLGWALGLLAALAIPASAFGQVTQVGSFDQLAQLVAEFQNGLQPNIINAQCTTPDPTQAIPGVRPFEPVDNIACLEGNTPIVGSAWDIMKACFVAYDTGIMVVGFQQSGVAGDGDGDGDPNTPSFQFDIPGVGPNESYQFEADSDFAGQPEFMFMVSNVDVGGFSTVDRYPSEGSLCLVQAPGISSPPVAGPDGGGCLDPTILGAYSAGTTGTPIPSGGQNVSNEVLIEISDITNLPFGRALNPSRLRLTLQSGSNELGETCFEDFTTFSAVAASIDLEKSAVGECRGGEYFFTATYDIVNDGLSDCDEVEIEDVSMTSPPGVLGGVTCRFNGVGVPVTPGPGDSFVASLGALPASDFDAIDGDVFPAPGDLDCGDDGIEDPSCGSGQLVCEWDGIPVSVADQVSFDNSATATCHLGDHRTATDDADATAVAVLTDVCVEPPGGGGVMRKEHEGVGFDNMVSLTPTLPGNSYGSGVDPNGLDDRAAGENFRAAGALPYIGKPGAFANLPKIPGGHGLIPQRGTRSVFNWRMLVTGDVNDFSLIDVTCALCSEKAWRVDGSPGQTYVPDLFVDYNAVGDYMIANEAVMMTVSHVCGPIHGPGSCGGTMSAVTTPGLKRRSSSVIGDNYVTFIGCKPTVVQFDPLSSGDLLLPGDFIDVQIIVPENERTKIRVDVTSCEAAYITMTPKALP